MGLKGFKDWNQDQVCFFILFCGWSHKLRPSRPSCPTWESTNWTNCVKRILTKPPTRSFNTSSKGSKCIYTTCREAREQRAGWRGGAGQRGKGRRMPPPLPPCWMSPARGGSGVFTLYDKNQGLPREKLAKHSFYHVARMELHHLALINRCGSTGPGSAKIWSNPLHGFISNPSPPVFLSHLPCSSSPIHPV